MDTMQEVIPVIKENALAAFKAADGSGKALLMNLLGKRHFFSDMTEIIGSFEDACEFNNTNPRSLRFTQGTQSGIALEMLAEIAKALNGGKVMKPNEKRYHGYFIHDEAGFRLIAVYYDVKVSYSAGGPRLCCADERLAHYMCAKFLSLFDNFLNPRQ